MLYQNLPVFNAKRVEKRYEHLSIYSVKIT